MDDGYCLRKIFSAQYLKSPLLDEHQIGIPISWGLDELVGI
jgi:hypothetical protein